MGPGRAYAALLAAGELKPDAEQERVVKHLQTLHESLETRSRARKGLIARLLGKPREPIPGLYIHGGVGRGKSMLMDLFFETARSGKKRRVHFHAFMLECHAIMHEWRQAVRERGAEGQAADDGDDPILLLAGKIASGAELLCFDEFQVADVADAMILGRLFEALFDLQVTIVATSNRAPLALYEGGLNRQLFLPFIEIIQDRMNVLELNGPEDYRLQRIKGMPVYYTPVNEATTGKLKEAFWRMTDRDVGDAAIVPSGEIEVQGRKLFVPKCSRGVAVFSFKRLCANPLGAADYLAIAWAFHTVFVVAIPKMGREHRNEAKRFRTLIDALYENGVKLICSAAAEPADLYPEGDGSFEFSRTASRLIEMQSEAYLARGHAV